MSTINPRVVELGIHESIDTVQELTGLIEQLALIAQLTESAGNPTNTDHTISAALTCAQDALAVALAALTDARNRLPAT